MTTNTTTYRADLLVLIAALIWGVAFYFQKTAMLHIGPFLFLGARCLIAATALAPFAFAEQQRNRQKWQQIVPIAMTGGLLFFIAGSIQQTGIQTATVTNAGFLTALYVVFTPLIAWIFLGQKPGAVLLSAVCLSIFGTWLLSGADLARFNNGDWLIAFSAWIWAAHIVTTANAARQQQPLTFLCLQFLAAGLLSTCAAFFTEPIVFDDVLNALDSILYVGLLSSALTFGIMGLALRQIAASRATIILSFEVVFAAIAGFVLLDERMSGVAWLGAGLIFTSILTLQLKQTR
ncbi:MAG: DMT family transporter [Pseudomonadaceae bacterium]|nr:DMT family transporter [Pseudomonadaceae bacterium]